MPDRATEGRANVTSLHHPRWQVERKVSGRAAMADEKYNRTNRKNFTTTRRKRAHDLCKKYGVRLSFYDALGWYPADIREALNGHS